ncbi:MAG: nucleotidyltransferase family protein [Leptolyngbya sp. BL-A-14]
MALSDRLHQILAASPVGTVLPAMAQLNLPDWWLAGGAVRNTVWRALFNDCALTINDFDLAFFDASGNRDQELSAKATLNAQFPDYVFDVKNQASFAQWRSGRRPYSSAEDGIADWLHTATAVGVCCDAQGKWRYFTPYGLEDLFNGIIRPTPAHLHNPDAERKATSFLEKCTCLRVSQSGE